MAKEKKEKLSLDELLEGALVKGKDIPYEVPGNWVWTKLDAVAKWGSGGTPSRANIYFYQGDIPWVKTGELNNDYIYDTEEKITLEAIQKSSAKLFPINTVVIAMYGVTIGKVAMLGVEATTNQACGCGIANSILIYKYLFYYLMSQKDAFIKKGKGGAQPNISQQVIKEHGIPLPPLAEQQRIVDVIESLFEKLDTAKELAQKALDSFENRKASIFQKAFTGELTAKWREENGVSLEWWEDTTIKDLTLLVTKGASPRWQGINYTDDNSQTLFVTSENVREGFIDLQKEKYLENKINDIQKRSILKIGDILLNIVGASIGRAAIFEINKLANINQAVCLIRLKDNVSKDFICNYLNSPSAMQYYSTNKVDVARANLSLADVNNMSFLLPSLVEQKEIVHILDNLLENEQRAKDLCDVIEKIDLLKKAILARAFRGELGTNDPEEECAVELLKEILKEKI